MKEYRICIRRNGNDHTSCITFRDWGGRQNWQGNTTDDERREAAVERLRDYERYERVYYGIDEAWVEEREVSEWKVVDA